MKRKGFKIFFLLSLIAVVSMTPGCGGKDASEVGGTDGKAGGAAERDSVYGAVIEYSDAEIKEMILTLQEDLQEKLGEGYEIVPSGSEGTYEGYYYKDLGLTFIFNHKLLWIDCDNNVDIHGASPGMTFEEIMEVLGNTEIQDTFIEIPENKAYEISYDFDGFTLRCESVNYDGSGSWFYIVPLRQEKSVSEQDLRDYLSMNEEELVQRLGKYYSIEEWIETPDGIRGVTAYYYDELSLGFAFDQNKNMDFIYVNPYGFLLDGRPVGTNFNEIRKRFGDTPAETVDLNGEKAYELRYRFDGYGVLAHAAAPESEYCSVFIVKQE